jgi:hypothetical protein
MKLIVMFAAIAITIGLKAKRLDRWVVLVLAVLIFLNILYNFLTFGGPP